MFFQVRFAPLVSGYLLVLQLQFSMNIRGVSLQFVRFLLFPFLSRDLAGIPACRQGGPWPPAPRPLVPANRLRGEAARHARLRLVRAC